MFVEEKSVGEIQVKTVKFSYAMREGAKLNKQAFGCLSDENGRTCALGAALTYAEANGFISEFLNHVPFEIIGAVYKLNDEYRMTREEIADWLEGKGY